MNVERCIELHNEIVQHGWVGSGRSPETLTSQSKSWFQLHGEKAEAARSDLSAELIQFLEQAQDPYAQESETCLSFFHWVSGLSGPSYMFGDNLSVVNSSSIPDNTLKKTQSIELP